jgi:hypothetical protein
VKCLAFKYVAVLASVSALVCAGSVAAASAEELAGADAEELSVQTCNKWNCPDEAANIRFHVGESISLGAPTVVTNHNTQSVGYHSYLNDEDAEKSSGFQTTYQQPFRIEVDVEVSWPILRGPDGAQTGHTVRARIHGSSSRWAQHQLAADCSVTGPSGGSRYKCYLNRRAWKCDHSDCWGYADWDLHLTDDRVDRLAEASGAIKTEGSVSLGNGEFDTDSSARIDGATTVPAGKSTQFDAVRKLTDGVTDPARKDRAHMAFTYALSDGGRPVRSQNGQQLYVSGSVSNSRGPFWFSGKSSCDIITADGTVVENSGYACNREGAHPNTGITDGRVHYITDFTIKKK